ncbi:MAG: hypothetical protein QNJ78_05965 [Gammaproteobacteria bacterium]|nr:hypothetical protein [Gammaproteobacteria bacterium]
MIKQLFSIVILGLCLCGQALAEGTPKEYCTQAGQLYEEGDLLGAIEEARWCLESLEQIQQAKKSEGFVEEVDGWKRGKISQQKVMGFSSIETQYSKADKTIKVTYNSGSGGMAGIFSQMGLAQAGKKVRIQRYTAIVMDQGNRAELMISLKQSGAMLNLSSSNASMDEVMEFAKQFPLKAVDQ